MTYTQIMEAYSAYVAEERPSVDNSDLAAKFIRPLMMQVPKQEQIWAIYTDTRTRVIGTEKVTQGKLNLSLMDMQAIIRKVSELGVAAVLLAHNHPSGDTAPSKEDIQMTTKIGIVMKLIDCRLLDHLIISTSGNGKYLSMRETRDYNENIIKCRYDSLIHTF